MPLRFAPLLLPRSVRSHASSLVQAISERLRLEVAAFDTPATPKNVDASDEKSDVRRLVVLVVDDEADMRIYLSQCLRAMDVPVKRVLEAADGVEALGWLAGTAVDLIIADVVMPRMDGLALCARLHDDPALRDVPVLLVSGEVALDEVRRGTPAGSPVTFLQKPFNARTLRDAIAEALR